jgi:hypothetical protein
MDWILGLDQTFEGARVVPLLWLRLGRCIEKYKAPLYSPTSAGMVRNSRPGHVSGNRNGLLGV